MSDYEPFEAAQGDPWSTEPVGDQGHQRREPGPDRHMDDSEVLARMPHMADEYGSDQYHQYGGHSGGHRRRRSPSRRPGVPTPVWGVVGLGLIALVAGTFFMSRDSGTEPTVDMPAPDADIAPTWAADGADSQWQQPGVWAEEPAPTATATAEPAGPGTWNSGGEWVDAPSNAPYAYNAGAAPAPFNQNEPAYPGSANPSAPPMGPAPSTGWDTSIAPAAPAEHGYPITGGPSQPTYGGADAAPAAGNWSEPSSISPMQQQPTMTQPPMGASPSWGTTPTTPSLATPQPENVMPGYGNYSTYPTAQPNPYVTNPSTPIAGVQGSQPGTSMATNAPQQYTDYSPAYPVAGQPPANSYPTPGYPQTAAAPTDRMIPGSSQSGYGSSPSGYSSNPSEYGSRPSSPATYPAPASPPSYNYPNYPPAASNPYAPQTAPAQPVVQPPYGAGASNDAAQRSIARLNGTIQEPAVRAAYDDRAGPSYY